jgi:iron complex outermembrane receptor protein
VSRCLPLLFATVILTGAPRASTAQAPPPPPAPDLMTATLEELMNVEITSAARKAQRAADVPAAISVLTREDIRRSGMTNIPDVLRLVPGVQVAQINANKWAVSIRGFNGLYSNKLLVLVDGRSVYNRLFSGVMWDAEDVMLEDIDRIEIIRGPGAATWGANAVNGVINILTRPASQTTGVLARVSGGSLDPALAAVRYGGSLGSLQYRVYSQWSDHGDSLLSLHAPADDEWRSQTAGFRGDWAAGRNSVMFEGSATRGRANALWANLTAGQAQGRPPALAEESSMNGGTVLGRWTRARRTGASLQVQSFIGLATRNEPVGDYRRTTSDWDVQYHTAVRQRHDVVAGGGFRFMDERFAGRTGYTLTPERTKDRLFNVFAQDEIAMAGNRVHTTLGARVEHDALSGWGVQPTSRIMWDMVPRHHHVWAAASRALRRPSLLDRGIRVDYPATSTGGPLPVALTLLGNPATRTEQFVESELGYRLDISTAATVDVTGFVGRYEHLRTNEPQTPSVVLTGGRPTSVSAPVRFDNLLAANTRGFEISARWMPIERWRLDAGYTAFHVTPHLDAASGDPSAARYDGDAPRQQWQVHSASPIGGRAELDLMVFRVGALNSLAIPAYTRMDARVEWRLARALSIAAAGQNLFDRAHGEFADRSANHLSTLARRTIRVELVWRRAR